MAKRSSHILGLAKKGAEARFRELLNEAKTLIQLFPDLRDSFDADELPISFIVAKGSGKLTARPTVKRGRGRSAAARKANLRR